MLTLALSLALSQLTVQDEGVNLGSAWIINCSGSGITCTRESATRRVTMAVSSTGGGDGGGIPDTIPVITYSASADLSAERVLSAGNYTVIDLGTAAQAQVDWSHGLTCSAGQALTTSGTTAMACTSSITASDLVCGGTCVSDAEIAGLSGSKVSGAVPTATALAADPTDCSAGQYATTIAASGNLTCSQVAFSQLSGTASIAQGGNGVTSRAANDVVMGTGVNTTATRVVPSCSNATTSKLLYDNTTQTWSCGTDQTGGGGSGNFLEQSVALTDTGLFQQVVTGQAWVTGTSKIVCSAFGTTADGLTPEAVAAAGLTISVSDLSAGVGFTINILSPNGLEGTVRVHCTGA